MAHRSQEAQLIQAAKWNRDGLLWGLPMARRSQEAQLIQAAKWIRDRLLWFLSKRPAHGDGRSEVDIGQCEPRGGAPRPPPQPTGPMGPLGSRPAHLAPRRAVQAPTPRPIQPGFTTWRPQNPSIMAPASSRV